MLQAEKFKCSFCGLTKERTPIQDTWASSGRRCRLYISEGSRIAGNICLPCRKIKRLKIYNCKPKRSRDYLRTLNGFIMNCYCNMRQRCEGKNKRTVHLYGGMQYPTKDEFYAWAKGSAKLKSLHAEYVKSGYQRRFSPSIDRIDNSKGYLLENMQWLTNLENLMKRHNSKKIQPTK